MEEGWLKVSIGYLQKESEETTRRTIQKKEQHTASHKTDSLHPVQSILDKVMLVAE
jgi:hypothetical protein